MDKLLKKIADDIIDIMKSHCDIEICLRSELRLCVVNAAPSESTWKYHI